MVSNELSGNVVDLCPVGALNNAPYSFQARPWELKSNYTIDCMDGMGSAIDAHVRGSDLLRILPRVSEEVNEEWISDKSRHSFDGLKNKDCLFQCQESLMALLQNLLGKKPWQKQQKSYLVLLVTKSKALLGNFKMLRA
jgi:NADH dehydrogenase/NADH:ubiquinone oxidoreductase subunit G